MKRIKNGSSVPASPVQLSLLMALRIEESAILLLNIGACSYAQERYEEALRDFERGLAAGPDLILHGNLGDAYRHLGREDEAAAAYRKARDLAEAEVTRNPRDGESRASLGMLSARLQDRRLAEFELSQALALEPDNATVISAERRALTTERRGDFESWQANSTTARLGAELRTREGEAMVKALRARALQILGPPPTAKHRRKVAIELRELKKSVPPELYRKHLCDLETGAPCPAR